MSTNSNSNFVLGVLNKLNNLDILWLKSSKCTYNKFIVEEYKISI